MERTHRTLLDGSDAYRLLEHFYEAKDRFDSFYSRHSQGEVVPYREVHDFVEKTLFPLKEEGHTKLRNGLNGTVAPIHNLVDLLLGAIFHETEDLRQAVHQALDYKPRLEQYGGSNNLSEAQHRAVDRLSSYATESEARIPRKYAEVKELFDTTMGVLERDFALLYKDQQQFLRTIVGNDKADFLVRGGNRFERIMKNVFPDGPFDAYYFTGMGFIESSHLGPAVETIGKMMDYYEINKDDITHVVGRNEKFSRLAERLTRLINDVPENLQLRRELRQYKVSDLEALRTRVKTAVEELGWN